MKLRERSISRTISVITCNVTIYEKETKQVSDVAAYVTGYTDPNEIRAYLEGLYNTNRYVMLDYAIVRKQVIKAIMSEEAFRLNADSWKVISDEAVNNSEVEG